MPGICLSVGAAMRQLFLSIDVPDPHTLPACVSMAATLRKLMCVLVCEAGTGHPRLQQQNCQQLLTQLPDLLNNLSRVVHSAHAEVLRLGSSSSKGGRAAAAAVRLGKPSNPSVPNSKPQIPFLHQLQSVLLTGLVQLFHGLADNDRRAKLSNDLGWFDKKWLGSVLIQYRSLLLG